MAKDIIKGDARFSNFSPAGNGFAKTKNGDIFIPKSIAAPYKSRLVRNARVSLQYIRSTSTTGAKFEAIMITDVKPAETIYELPLVVDWFNLADNGFGFGSVVGENPLSRSQVYVHRTACEKAGIVLEAGDKIIARCIDNDGQPKVLSFRHGTDVTAEIDARLAIFHAEDGADVELDAGSVDALMAEYAAETQAAIGQLPTDGVEANAETASEAPVKPKQRRAPKPTVRSLAELGALVPGSQPNGSAVEASA